jgi:putative MFS transporter
MSTAPPTLADIPSAGAIGARLDRMPITGFHRRLLLVIGAGLLVDGVDVYLTSGVAGALVKQGAASLQQVAALAAATTIGLGLGGFISGVLADRLGRRPTLRWTLLVVIVGSVGAALAPSVPALLAWRFVTALGLGGETVLGYAMLGEFLPPAFRGRWLARLALLSNLGMPLALFLGYFVLPLPEGWRWMLAIPGVAAIPVLYLRRSLSESPRWLVTQARHDEADTLVSEIENSGPQPLPPVALAPALHDPASPEERISTLFAPDNRMRLAVGASICIAIMSAVFGFVSWLPTFFVAEGKDIASSALFAGFMSVGCPVGVLLGMQITDRIERKWGVVAGSLIAAFLGACYAFSETSTLILLTGFLVVTAVYVTGTLGLIGYVPELFPTALRMRGVGFSATAGRVVAVGLPFAIAPIFSTWGQAGVVGLISLILFAQALIVAAFGVRTRGRPLEAI